jgi:DNA polymerase III subunit gamma/tau
MSYLVLARKYRPKIFDDVVGQESIATTLKNAIASNRIAHAYLFSGPRGVGKTSLARILARSLNCKKGPTPSPCGQCPACLEIEKGSSLDVVEIDGASNRGIEDVRAIRENIKFSPASGRYKIYIIDEVHQITPDGFNALLKTLEEPPAHAKFIFATTSPQKVPATVLSRCQRFEFKRISTNLIIQTLERVAKDEKITIKKNALFEIARTADGSLRDAESILDQMASFSKKEIAFEDVQKALGSLNPEEFFKLFDAIAQKDTSTVLNFVDKMIQEGKEPVFFLERCLEHVRNLLVVTLAGELTSLIDASDTYCDQLKKQGPLFSKQDLFYFFSVMVQTLQNVRRFNSKRVLLEMGLLKCAMREPMIPLENALKKNPKISSKSEDPPKIVSSPEPSSFDGPMQDDMWAKFLKEVRHEKISAASFLSGSEPLGIQGDMVVIGFPPELSFNMEALSSDSNTRILEKHLSEIRQRKTRVHFKVQKDQSKTQGSTHDQEAKSQDVSTMKKAIGIFGGRIIKEQ